MPSEFNWNAFTDQGDILTPNNLGNGNYSASGTEFNNSTSLHTYAILELDLDYVTAPSSSDHVVYVYPIYALDGSNYPAETGDALVGKQVDIIPVDHTASAQKVNSKPFMIFPFKVKFVLRNEGGSALAASGNTVRLYTGNLEAQ